MRFIRKSMRRAIRRPSSIIKTRAVYEVESRWIQDVLDSQVRCYEPASWPSKATSCGGMACVMLSQDDLLRALDEVKG